MNFLFVVVIDMNKQGPSVHLINDVVKATINRGHKVYMTVKDTSDNHDNLLRHPNLEYIFVKDKPIHKNNFIIRYFDELRFMKKCSYAYKDLKNIDAVFMQSNTVAGFSSYFINRYLHIPILYNVQDIFPDDLLYVKKWKKSNIIYLLLRATQKMAYKRCEKIITISPDMKQNLMTLGIPDEKIEVVYNWSYGDNKILIDNKDNKFIEKYSLNTDSFNVLYAGNIGKKQNIDILINAARELKDRKDITFTIVGDGSTDYYKSIASDESLNIKFFPLQPSSLAEHVYSYADIIVITLKDGIIYTALPSKTATCLRLDKPVVFCIGEKSEFANSIKDYTNIFVSDCEDYARLSQIILEVKEKKITNKNSGFVFFENNMSCIENPNIYANWLEKLVINKEE